MTRDLAGRVALVTGSTKGIGRAVALRLAADGAQVVVNGRDVDAAEHVAAEIAALGGPEPMVIPGDASDRRLVDRLVGHVSEHLGGIDILVNNAWGGTRVNRLEHKDEEQFAAAFELAFYASYRLMHAAFPHMRDQGWGRIVNVCSLNGVNAHLYTAEYNVAKEALRTLTRTAAREWFRYGIVANALCPFARVERHDAAWGSSADDVAADVGRRLPAGRMGDPELDIAGVVSFLASEDARFLTGNTLFADGGGHISGVQWDPVPEEDTGEGPVETAIHRAAAGVSATREASSVTHR